MKAASGFASGPKPTCELAEAAVGMALAAAGIDRAGLVLLLLSREFSRHPAEPVLAAARRAGCLQVAGCTASGLLTEAGWLVDQPAAAALVIAELPTASPATNAPCLSFSGHATLPFDWLDGPSRAGLLEADAAAWVQARPTASACAELTLPGLDCQTIVASGLRLLEQGLRVDACAGYELRRVAGLPAAESLRRALPADRRAALPVHRAAVVHEPGAPAIAILSANADGSLTLAAPLAAGQQIAWAMRQPLAAEQEMHQLLAAGAEPSPPAFALMFSCIGRGPLFYGNEDRDLLAFRQRHPGVPLLGAYGSGQIAPTGAGNRLFQNSAITLLYRSPHV
ncbi:MAG: hypothetical protein CVU18_08930 [Betaproteobacteria bacterium HGW-Betaproteobacteria-12]|nr:MAG: hypothetical protein CVU18_08930 [Betaproteobacteria bacterium HGW-Betaproteobacteria-12]